MMLLSRADELIERARARSSLPPPTVDRPSHP
jgi:hypothetical protein